MDSSQDDASTSGNVMSSLSTEAVLKTSSPIVEKGRISCAICFIGNTRKHLKRSGFEKILDINKFKVKALEWCKFDHEYNSIYGKLDWAFTQEVFAHKKCKSIFFKETFMSCQKLKISEVQVDIDSSPNNAIECIEVQQQFLPRKSARKENIYHSSPKDIKCIICAEVKKDKTGKVIPIKTITFRNIGETVHAAEKRLVEFANIHVNKESMYKAGGERILLTLSTKSLFAADVGYHRACYESFRSPKWKKEKEKEDLHNSSREIDVKEFLNLVEYLITVKKEVYTLSQLRDFYGQIQDVRSSSIRSIDIKEKIEEKMKNRVIFCKPTQGCSNASEYVVPADVNILPDAIHAISTGEGITNYLQLKSIAQNISKEIQSKPKKPWPPTPQDIVESEETYNKRLFNFIAWIVSPISYMYKMVL